MPLYEDADDNCIRREIFRRLEVRGFNFTPEQLEQFPKLAEYVKRAITRANETGDSSDVYKIVDLDEVTNDPLLTYLYSKWSNECIHYPKRIALRYGPDYQDKVQEALKSFTAVRLSKILMCPPEEAVTKTQLVFPDYVPAPPETGETFDSASHNLSPP